MIRVAIVDTGVIIIITNRLSQLTLFKTQVNYKQSRILHRI